MAASDVRLTGLELQMNITALKTAVDAVKVAVDAINTVTTAWVFDDEDAALPTASAVKTQLAAYDALSVSVSKPSNSITDSLAVIRAEP